jgi:hypothetical protein
MTNKDSSTQDEPEPVQETTQADEQDTEYKADVSAPLPVVNPSDAEAETPKPAESYDETDRKQDEAIDSLAEQTNWIAKQTKWMRVQTIASIFLGIVTLGVLVYHGWIMGRQSQDMKAQTEIMKGQLESMKSDSAQTQQMIEATQRMAEQNEKLVGHAGTQAEASLAQADAAKQSVGAAESSAKAAEQGAQIARQSFYIGDRPYVSVRNSDLDELKVGEKPRATIFFINTGKTPAFEFRMGAIISIGRLPEPDLDEALKQTSADLVYPFMSKGSRSTLPASVETGGLARATEVLSQETLEEIKSGKMYLFIWGGGLYKDGLGKPHRFLFCVFYTPADDSFTHCPTFNSTN